MKGGAPNDHERQAGPDEGDYPPERRSNKGMEGQGGVMPPGKEANMNIIRRGSGYLPDGTAIYIEDWTPDKIQYHPYVVAAFPISKVTLPGTWSPDAGRKFRYGMTFETFREAAECADKLMRGETKLGDYADHLERAEYAQCV